MTATPRILVAETKRLVEFLKQEIVRAVRTALVA
jgi:hypothetical protein